MSKSISPREYFDCDTGAQFIRVWQSAKKAARSGRNLADKLKLSPATVSCSLNEASVRHSPWPLDRLDALLGLMKLEASLGDFLWLLLRRDHADTLRQRAELTLRIESARTYAAGRKIESAEARLLSSWHHLAAFELAHLRGLTDDAATLADLLIPPVSEAAMAEALALTEEQGLIRRRHGTLEAAEDHVLSLPEDRDEAAAVRRAMKRLHQWYLRRAGEALSEFSRDERFFHADLLMVPVSARDEIFERVGRFHSEMLTLAAQRRAEADPSAEHQLEFLGMQVFPLSETVRGSSE